MTERPPRLHVLELSTQFGVGGICRHILTLRAWLEGQGHRISLAGAPDRWVNTENGRDYLPLAIDRVAGEAGHPLPGRLLAAAQAGYRLRRWLRANRIDLIHAHESAPALVGLLARTGLGIPLIVTYHGSAPERVAGFGAIARRCDLTVTPSHASADDLRRLGGLAPERLRVIGLGVDLPPPVSDSAIAACRAALLGDGDRLILTLVRLTHQKGVDVFIDCVARLRRDHPGWRFVIAGDGPDEAMLKALAEARGVTPVLRFIGRTSEPHLHLAAADLFLLTSRWEALPFTLVESFRAGTPTVATRCAGVVELVDDSVGAVVPVGDVAAICAAVERILGDPARQAAMAAAALRRGSEARFRPEAVHPQIEALYHEIARQGRARPA